jgi:hypothetical protein
MTLNIEDLTDRRKVAEIEVALRDPQHFMKVNVTVGEHDTYGHVVLIKSSDTTRAFHGLLIADKVRFIGSADDPTLDPAFLDE